MSDLMKNLSAAAENMNEDEILKILRVMLAQETTVEIINSTVVTNLLKSNRTDIIQLSTEVIAEWAKTESNRKMITDEFIVSNLMDLLKNSNVDIVFNAIRALGNICYENKEACSLVEKVGISNILQILRDDDKRKDQLLTTKTSGFLLNLVNVHDGLCQTILKNEIMPTLEKLLTKYSKTSDENLMLLTFLLSILNHLLDYTDDQNISFTEEFCRVVISIFKSSTNPEISVICLEIFHGQSEKEEIKSLLAKEGVCELLFELIKKIQA
ncbi:hypothetical protein NQ315_004655 [Exocentrus adspersus]|uniref:TFIIS N-terminal domain-containing protein n=1 Tax=Exocentrus adspersus TaxID=1586481 RepID=A0AAV8VN86_9CUCU|nr:hypothetical protein NQ315_004655 [Exocentrus adspersus]